MNDLLYRYALIAARNNTLVSINSSQWAIRNDEILEHVRTLFEVPKEVHEHAVSKLGDRPQRIVLNVGLIEAVDLLAKDANGLSDPYCYVFLANNNQTTHLSVNNDVRKTLTPTSSPNVTPSSSPKFNRKASCRGSSFRSVHSNTDIASSHKTEICRETLNPKWNENFEYEIKDPNSQTLIIQCYDYDNESATLLANFTQKNSVKSVFRSFRNFFENRKIADDFLGQIRIPISDIGESSDKWYDLLCKHNNESHRQRGKIHVTLSLSVRLENSSTNTYSFESNQSTPDLIPTTELDRSSLLSNTETQTVSFIEDYHKLLQIIYKKAFQSIKLSQNIEWDGSIHFLSQKLLKSFRDTFLIKNLSKKILEVTTLMEYKIENRHLISNKRISTHIDELYSDWQRELAEKPLVKIKFSDYEKTTFGGAACAFIADYFNYTEFTTFPPDSEKSQILLDTIKFSSRIKNIIISICEHECGKYKETVSEVLVKHIQDDIRNFIRTKINVNNAAEKNDTQLLRWMNSVNDAIKSLVVYSEFMPHNGAIFNLFDIDYCKIAAITISKELTGSVQFVLKCINEYQTEYRKFTPNMKSSSRVAYYLFIYCRELCNFLSKYVPERELFKLQLRDYPTWFKEQGIVTFWLETYRIVAKEFVINALQLEDVKEISNGNSESSGAGISLTSVIVAEHLLVMGKEWNEVNFPDTEIRYLGAVILTEIICDTCRLFVQTLKYRLEQLNYYFEAESLALSMGQIDPIIKICICMNNIEYIKTQTISSLSSLLKYDEIATEMESSYNDDTTLNKNIKETLEKSVNEAVKDMDTLTRSILENMAQLLVPMMRSKVNAFFLKKNPNLFDYLHKNLYLINTKMPSYCKSLVIIMWNNLMKLMCQCLPEKEISTYYQQILKELTAIEELFISYDLPFNYIMRNDQYTNSEILEIIETERLIANKKYSYRNERKVSTKPVEITYLDKLTAKLKHMSQPTTEIIIEHLRHLSEPRSTSPDQDTFGTILFKIGYEEESKHLQTLRITIKIMYCKNLPILDVLSKSSDPYVVVELLPNALFSNNSFRKTRTIYKDLNPRFDEVMIFTGLSKEYFKKEGVCVRLSVWDADVIGEDDFAGEIFYPLMYIDNMEKLISIDIMPVIMQQLTRPTKSERIRLKELERRSDFDNEAKEFYKHRHEVLKQLEAYENDPKPSGTGHTNQHAYMSSIKKTWDTIINPIKCLSMFNRKQF